MTGVIISDFIRLRRLSCAIALLLLPLRCVRLYFVGDIPSIGVGVWVYKFVLLQNINQFQVVFVTKKYNSNSYPGNT